MLMGDSSTTAGTGAQGGSGDSGASQGDGALDNKQGSQGSGSGSTDNPGKDGAATSGEGEKLDVSKLPPEVQKLIKDLRTENAGHRQKNKSLADSHGKLKTALVEAGLIEDDEEQPEEKLKSLTAFSESAVVENAILRLAVEHGIGKDDLEFFQFLVSKGVSELDEDGELSEEDVAELAKKARRSASGGSGSSSTSVTQGAPSPGATGTVTLDKFVKMNMGEKADLYAKNKDLYSQLMAEAKAKRVLV